MNPNEKAKLGRNGKNAYSLESGERIKKTSETAKTCFFCTLPATKNSFGVRPMNIQKSDEDGTLWFLSGKDSHKNQEIVINPEVTLYLQDSPDDNFAFLRGTAEISDDKEKIRELWDPYAKIWFTDGENDTMISVIKVIAETGIYWGNKRGL